MMIVIFSYRKDGQLWEIFRLYLLIMNTLALKDKRVADLVDENYVHGYVLFYFGINFYDVDTTQTLEEACKKNGLRVEQVVRELESPTHLREANLPLVSYPIDLIIEYLKHSHFLFIKHKLPYIAKLIENFKAKHVLYEHVERDLKIVFPLFVEDFIHHIYEEEDTLFVYIRQLQKASKGKLSPTKLYCKWEKNALQKFAMEHEVHDDEMAGIRKITNDYQITEHTPLHIKVLYSELKEFERSLQTHARIENEILFPKAMTLEELVRKNFQDKIQFN
jgi:regulator of cell morphogenesis and NO signaling